MLTMGGRVTPCVLWFAFISLFLVSQRYNRKLIASSTITEFTCVYLRWIILSSEAQRDPVDWARCTTRVELEWIGYSSLWAPHHPCPPRPSSLFCEITARSGSHYTVVMVNRGSWTSGLWDQAGLVNRQCLHFINAVLFEQTAMLDLMFQSSVGLTAVSGGLWSPALSSFSPLISATFSSAVSKWAIRT